MVGTAAFRMPVNLQYRHLKGLYGIYRGYINATIDTVVWNAEYCVSLVHQHGYDRSGGSLPSELPVWGYMGMPAYLRMIIATDWDFQNMVFFYQDFK
jgi:hypothetical protein